MPKISLFFSFPSCLPAFLSFFFLPSFLTFFIHSFFLSSFFSLLCFTCFERSSHSIVRLTLHTLWPRQICNFQCNLSLAPMCLEWRGLSVYLPKNMLTSSNNSLIVTIYYTFVHECKFLRDIYSIFLRQLAVLLFFYDYNVPFV